MKRWLIRLRALLRLHLDIPSAIILTAIVLIAAPPLITLVSSFTGILSGWIEITETIAGYWHNILANVISAIIIIPIVYWLLRLTQRADAMGSFAAYDIKEDGSRSGWGRIDLTYNLFSNRVRGVLTRRSVELKIEATIVQGQYLVGYYVERSNAARRRCGGFLMHLDGGADSYSGQYVFVDPDGTNITPTVGQAIWVRVGKQTKRKR
ncbi:MAG: hypothetical protein WD081_03830 [Gammaproteobacteria bacterium]